MIDMTYWCESCARKNICYTIRSRPKCFTPITNTAHGTPESYLAKSLRYSQDSHEIAKTESDSEKPNNCETCRFDDRYGDESICKECARHYSDNYAPIEDEPQTKRPIQCSECRAWHRCFKEKPSYNMIKSRCPIDEPQTDMAEDIVRSYGFKAESYRQAKAKTEQTERSE